MWSPCAERAMSSGNGGSPARIRGGGGGTGGRPMRDT
ncbi:hypothetical protein Gobs01_04636 [Geodermatophilus obscurus DSM 43160]